MDAYLDATGQVNPKSFMAMIAASWHVPRIYGSAARVFEVDGNKSWDLTMMAISAGWLGKPQVVVKHEGNLQQNAFDSSWFRFGNYILYPPWN